MFIMFSNTYQKISNIYKNINFNLKLKTSYLVQRAPGRDEKRMAVQQ